MATRTVLESDLSGQPDAATTAIGFDGTWYQTDLTQAEQEELEQLIAPYVRAGRRVGSTLKPKKVVPETSVAEREKIRSWAEENGYKLADYGRIPKHIFAAYQQAHPGAA